jgi:S-DNA-T family DNA segregation ATPase FtsK/SpoIIIE
MAPIANKMKDAVNILMFLKAEIERRIQIIKRDGLMNLDQYEKSGKRRPFPYIAFVVDEVIEMLCPSELIADGDIERMIKQNKQLSKIAWALYRSLASQSRAAGVNMIAATQMPSADMFPIEIRANFTASLTFRLHQESESQSVLGNHAASKLKGQGQGIFRHDSYKTVIQAEEIKTDEGATHRAAAESIRRYGKPDFSAYEQFVAEMAAAEDGGEDVPLNSFGKEVMAAA